MIDNGVMLDYERHWLARQERIHITETLTGARKILFRLNTALASGAVKLYPIISYISMLCAIQMYFAKTNKEAPHDADSANARLQGGFVDQLMAGVYTFLPLGSARA